MVDGDSGSFYSNERSDRGSNYHRDLDSDAMSYGSSFYSPANEAVRARRPWGQHRRQSEPDVDQEQVQQVQILPDGGQERAANAGQGDVAGQGLVPDPNEAPEQVEGIREIVPPAQVPVQNGVGGAGAERRDNAYWMRVNQMNQMNQIPNARFAQGLDDPVNPLEDDDRPRPPLIAQPDSQSDSQPRARGLQPLLQQRPARIDSEGGVAFQPPLPGGPEVRAKAVPYERMREVGLAMQRRIGPDHFYRRGRYGAAAVTAVGQTVLRVGQVASGAASAAAVTASGGGALVATGAGFAAESAVAGLAGAMGDAFIRPEQEFAGTEEGKIAAAQARRDEWNSHYLGRGGNGEQVAQPRSDSAAQRGVRFAERGDPLITGEQTIGQRVGDYATPTARMGGGLFAKIVKGIGNKAKRFAGAVTRWIRSIGRSRAPGQRPAEVKGNRAEAALGRLRAAQGEGPQLLGGSSARNSPVGGDGEPPLIEAAPAAGSDSVETRNSLVGGNGEPALIEAAPAARSDSLTPQQRAWKSEFAPLRDHWSAPKAWQGARTNLGFWRGQARGKLKEDYADLPTGKEHRALSAIDRAELLEREQLAVAPKIASVEERYAALQTARGAAPAQSVPARSADEIGLDDRIRERGDALSFVDAVNERRKAAKVFGTLGGGGSRAAASALSRENRAAQRALEPLVSRVDPEATPDNGKQGSTWKAMAGELNGNEPNWPVRNRSRQPLSDIVEQEELPDDDEARSATDGAKAGSGMQTAGQVLGVAQHVEQVRRMHGQFEPIGRINSAISPALPVFPLIGAATNLASGLVGTAAAYQNRHADPALTSTEEQRNVASAQEALEKRRAQFAQDQELKASGKEVPAFGTKSHGMRMFQAMVGRVKANTALEKAQTGAGIRTLDEYTMKQSQGLMVDPARAQELKEKIERREEELRAQEKPVWKDPRLGIAEDELQVRNLLRRRAD